MWTAVIAGAAAGLASVPHCTAMCGPLAAYACSGRPGASGQARYQLGRFISYSVLGGIAGAVGGATAVSLPAAWGSALLSWSLALGLGLAAFRLWRRPDQPLVPLRKKDDEPAESTGARAVRALGRHPFFVGLGTALLPCGALAAAVLIAASTGTPSAGALSMLAFSVVSGVGLVGAAWLALPYGTLAVRNPVFEPRAPRGEEARRVAASGVLPADLSHRKPEAASYWGR